MRSWLQLFLLTHRATPDGWQRQEWPDGGALLAQPWPQVLLLHTLADELEQICAERRQVAARALR